MSAPVWIASPPEVHSAMLSSGPGPGPLLSAAGAWMSLSAEYTSVAAELTAMLDGVHAGAWQGPTAEQYAAAHAPYLAWLSQAGSDSAGVAVQHEAAASAYTAALATMPTLAELAANHMIHGVLVATNFFGVNTIPIALNEADYARMWVQAAATMGTYHTVSGLALASAPRTGAAPPVVKADRPSSAASSPAASGNFFTDLFDQLNQLIQNPSQVLSAIMANPAAWFPLLFFIGYEAFFIPFGNTFWSLVLSSPALILPIAIGVGVNLLLAGGLAAPEAAAAAAPGAARAAEPKAVVAGFAAGIATPGAPGVPATAAPAAAAPAAPVTGVAGFGYLVASADPGTGLGPTLIDRTKAPAAAARVPAAAAGIRAVTREQARARRRRRARLHDHADEFMDMDGGVPAAGDAAPSASGSDRGAGPLGFSGTAQNSKAGQPAGLATLAGDGFGGGPNEPMLPESWNETPESGESSRSTQVAGEQKGVRR